MLSKRLKLLRAQTPYSQEEIANKIGVARTTYAMYEQGKREPDNETIEKLADYYDVTIDYLYGRTDNPNRISDKDEKDIAKRLKQFEAELENSDGLAFDGEPMSDEAKESLLESMELLFRQTQRINKKYAPKKYREDE